MRIATYNIMSGGFNSYVSSIKSPERLEILRQAIGDIGADFVGLTDTFRWRQIYSRRDLEELFGFRHVYHINLDDRDKKHPDRKVIGITVLSNLPVEKFETVRIGTRNCLKAQLISGGKKLDIFTVYLTDLSESERLVQIQSLLGNIDKSQMTVLMGDFNAIDPSERATVEKNFQKFLDKNPSFKKREDYKDYFVPAFAELLKAQIVPLIERFGFQDSSIKGRAEATAWTKLSPFKLTSIARVDHIFTDRNAEVKGFLVLKNGIFEKASDHYPIMAEIS